MKTFLSILLVILTCGNGFSQILKDPTEWTFEVKKKDATHYTLLFRAAIKEQWHIYGINPGKEEGLRGTLFAFNNGRSITVKETTRPKVTRLEGIDNPVNLHSGKAEFSAMVSGKAGEVISGTVEYQACNNSTCLPPKKKTFSFTLR